ncbi:MAG: hypothetical protein B6A08_20495 [Sorangiineae bacterium NIC37A_2]|nr:MAG: hypothetical protein B6A08_20495 [Sorangiineae bacterium NIC37A_2]
MPSTVIADMAYDPDTETLSVWFRPSGRRYDYFEVPAAVYDALRRSRSKGRYFNARIRDAYPFAKAEGPRSASPTSATMPKTYTTTVTRG